jgi:hypothetical protein
VNGVVVKNNNRIRHLSRECINDAIEWGITVFVQIDFVLLFFCLDAKETKNQGQADRSARLSGHPTVAPQCLKQIFSLFNYSGTIGLNKNAYYISKSVRSQRRKAVLVPFN